MGLLTITTRPDAFQFEAHEVNDLRDALIEANRTTLITPIGSIQDVMLNPDTGQTCSGFTYSDVAFLQISSLLSSGLASIVLDLSGQYRKPGEDKHFFSGAYAVELFNRVLRLRFDRRLAGMQLVKDTKRKVIDGVVSARYRYLSNIDFYELVTNTFARQAVHLLEACLYGRQLILRFTYTGGLSYNVCGDEYLPGFHFGNTEVGGRSVRTANVVIKRSGGYCALGPYRDGGRVVHSGRSFDRRVNSILSNIVNKLPTRALIEDKGNSLQSKSLGLGGQNADPIVKHLTGTLARKRLTLGFSQRVVSSAASLGSGENDGLMDMMPDERKLVLESRTGYDLFVALIREARKLPIDQREVAEQVAYALLTGKISI